MPPRKRKPVRRPKWKRKQTQRVLASKVNYLIRSREMKHHDYSALDELIRFDVANKIYCLTSMAQGTYESMRIGNTVTPRSISIRLKFRGDVAVSQESSTVRILLIRDREDKQECGSPILDDIYENPAEYYRQISPILVNKSKRIQVLYEKVITLDGISSGANMRYIKINKYLNPKHKVCFDGVNTTDNSFNHIWLVITGDQTDGHGSNYDIYSRFLYFDA